MIKTFLEEINVLKVHKEDHVRSKISLCKHLKNYSE